MLVDPDDEGRRPAGTITFGFLNPITEFGADLIDVEHSEHSGAFTFRFEGEDVGTVLFSDLTDPLSEHFQPSVDFGDNFANRIAPIQAADLVGDRAGGKAYFDEVEVLFNGSGAIDNLVPAPSAAALFALAGLGAARRRRR